jgi:DNA helicase-2/ATP-dependent DNA helicase PcrA
MQDPFHEPGHPQRRIAYESELNPAQLEAVMFNEGPLLVIAGAGSGKTRTLTYRVARLVEDGIAPGAILLLTFTRKASAEMLRRASRLLDDRCGNVSGGTFHSFANSILRRYASALGFDTRFTILDRSDSESLIGMAKKEIGPSTKQRGFPRNQTLANIFSKTVNKSLALEELIFNDYPHLIPLQEPVAEIFQRYEMGKRQHNFLDYDDLLLFLYRLLQDQPAIRDRIAAAYRFIMVDEYQDTNLIQAEILHHLAGGHGNVMAVGDDSQSIYAFRGANFKNIMRFPDIYPNTKIIGLEENYRSVQPILSLTNAIIVRAAERYEKELFTRRAGGEDPLLVETNNENEQSLFVVSRIRERLGAGVPANRIAVLFRASFHSFDLEIELAREQIAYVKVGGFKFMESAHIKDLLAHLRVLVNPFDRISWYRLLLLLEKVGAKTAGDIYEAVVAENAGCTGLLTVKDRFRKVPGLEKLADLFGRFESTSMSVAEMGEAALAYYEPILRVQYDDHPRRLKDLEQLMMIMQRYRNLEEFLIDMALEPPSTRVDDHLAPDERSDERIVLSTIHSAKGLEWDTVFIIWAVDGRFPSIHSLDDPDSLEEELRLMYVAATRARQHLLITYPVQVYDRGSGLMFGRPSRFVDGLPLDVLERVYFEL